MNEKKYYVVGVTTPEVWDHVHRVLTQDGSLDDNIPTRPVECTDLKEQSPTRAGTPIIFYDCAFGGTSAACPVATGFIATALETNRSWGWANVRAQLQLLTEQSETTFYQGPDPDTAQSGDWADLNSLMGGIR